MRKRLFFLGSLLIGSLAYGSGNQVGLTVSSGTYQAISTYANDDGANRQAIVLGDFSSSTTLRVDGLRGIPVYLSTTSASNVGNVTVVQSTVGIVGSISNTGFNVNNTPAVTQSGAWIITQSTVGIVGSISNTTFAATQSGAWAVTGTTVGIVNGGSTLNATINAALPTGSNNIGTVNGSTVGVANGGSPLAVISTGTFTPSSVSQPVTSTYTTVVSTGLPIINLAGTQITVVSTGIPIIGSISATSTEASTGTINSTVPSIATLVGAQGVSGNLSSFRVDASSYLYVNVAAGGASGGTSSSFNATFPNTGTAIGWVNPTGGMGAARVDVSSNQYVNIVNPTTSTITGTVTVVSTGIPIIPSVIGQPVTSTYTTVVSTGLPFIPSVNAQPVTSTSTQVQGMVASGGANANNPVKIGIVASSNVLTGVNDTQITNLIGTRMGAMLATLDCPRELVVKSSNTITSSTAETVILSSGATGVFNDLVGLIALNTSGSAARIDIRSGGSGGTIDFGIYWANGDTRGFTISHPWIQTSSATVWTAQSNASVSDIRIYGLYCKSK